jgi:hypothetical protein
MNHFWAYHFAENRIYDGFPVEIVERILEDQIVKVERLLDGEEFNPYIVIVLDIISENNLRYSKL